MYGETETSNRSRVTLILIHSVILVIVALIYLGGLGNPIRLSILFIFSSVYFGRMLFTLFSFLNRKVDGKEIIAISTALAIYHIGFALTGSTQPAPIDFLDMLPIFLFIIGSYFNTWSEYQRKRFKAKEENKGKLYTEGLFRYSQHINYFGDFVWILGFALMTRNLWAFIMPLLCLMSFIFINIPMLDEYLKEKYKDEFEEWNKKTKKFVPFIY